MVLYRAVLSIVAPLVCAALFDPIVVTEFGKVRGFDNGNLLKKATVEGFNGIPYADPPLGAHRFRPPQPFSKPWAPGIRSAKKEGNICVQLQASNWQGSTTSGHEDCLFLNVYRPAGVKEGMDLPVVVWIYGGGFIFGDGMNFIDGLGKLYDPTNIVERHGYIFVSMNYRVAGLGFFALPELAAEHPLGLAGNYGTLDQRAAMQWVQRNIRSFGGDPSKVTIQGESAGSISVGFHLVSPASKGLFRGAIEESGSVGKHWFLHNQTDIFKFSRQWAAIQGCSQTGPELLICLRKLEPVHFTVPVVQWVEDWTFRFQHRENASGKPILPKNVPEWANPLFPFGSWGPVIDGTSDGFPDWPDKLLEAGQFNKVPLITGANYNGGALMGWALPLLWGDLMYPVVGEDLTKVAKWFIPKAADQTRFLEIYGGSDNWPSSTFTIDRVDRFFRDAFFLCPARETSTHWAAHGQPVYDYVFSFDMHTNFSQPFHGLTATHAFELPFVFRNWLSIGAAVGLHKKEWEAMSDVMSCTWASFVTCQKPKCPSNPPPNCVHVLDRVPEWPAFSTAKREYISFKKHTTIETVKSQTTFPNDEFPGDDRCDFWKTDRLEWQGIRRYPDSLRSMSSESGPDLSIHSDRVTIV